MMAVLSLAAYAYAPPVSPHVGAGRVTIPEGTSKGSVSVSSLRFSMSLTHRLKVGLLSGN